MTSQKSRKYYTLLFIMLLIVLAASIIIASTIGVAKISFYEALYIILSRAPLVNRLLPQMNIISLNNHSVIIINLRLPRIILAALIGMGLSMVGAAFQAIFKNPMADPYVLGVSSGSAVGAATAIVLGFNTVFLGIGIITISAFIGSLITTFVVYNIARIGNKIPTVTLLLAGVAVSFFLSSIISLLMVFYRQDIDKIIFWTMGSVSTATWQQVITVIPFIVICFILMMAYSKDLNIMLTGDEIAKSLGVEVEKVKKLILIVSSVVIAVCVSVSGVIGFVGLIIPHIVRMLLGSNHRVLIPFSLTFGALFMIIADTFSRTLAAPAEIPIGAITSLIGAPYFIYLLIKLKKKVM
jgi:iron complex transport system permease protein